jgi:prefoldin subunit 5
MARKTPVEVLHEQLQIVRSKIVELDNTIDHYRKSVEACKENLGQLYALRDAFTAAIAKVEKGTEH